MIEELKNTEIINKVGGRFKLSALMQKRMIELMEGGRPLIEDTEGMTPMRTHQCSSGKSKRSSHATSPPACSSASSYSVRGPCSLATCRLRALR